MKLKKLLSVVLLCFAILPFVSLSTKATAAEATIDMYRMYNPNSGEHFYTANGAEKSKLSSVGWKYEGIGWQAPVSGDPVYRMYNANAGDHHYTTNAAEKANLESVGWKYEGIGWYSSTGKEFPLYRAYNPNAKAGSHNYTTNAAEQNSLFQAGWKDEGIAWYGVGAGTSVAPEQPVTPPVAPPATGDTVYVTKTGTKYHYNRNCRGLSNANSVRTITLSEALAQGYTLCRYEK